MPQDLTLHCTRCGRTGRDDILACPEHQTDNCAFVVDEQVAPMNWDSSGRPIAWRDAVIIGVIGLVISLFIGLFFQEAVAFWIPFILTSVMVGFIVCARTYHTLLLYDPGSGQHWLEVWALGFLWQRTYVGPAVPAALDLPGDLGVRYPLSLTAYITTRPTPAFPMVPKTTPPPFSWRELGRLLLDLPAKEHISQVMLAALISLLAEDAIIVEAADLSQSYIGGLWPFGRGVEPIYLLLPGPNADHQPAGSLEDRILDVVNSWDVRPSAQRWPHGAPVRALIKEMFPYRSKYDALAQFKSLLTEDAVSHRLGPPPRTSIDPVEVMPALAPKIAQEAEALEELQAQLEAQDPIFVVHVTRQVRKGV